MKNQHHIDSIFDEKWEDAEFWRHLYFDVLKQEIENAIPLISFTDLPENISKIRKRIFGNQEFLELSRRISSYQPDEEDEEKKTSRIKRVYRFRDFFDHTFTYTSKFYTRTELGFLVELLMVKYFHGFSEILNVLFRNHNFYFHSLCILLANEYTSCFIPYYGYNLDLETKKNFYVSYFDEIFQVSEENGNLEEYELLKVTPELMENPFFYKRFSKSFLKSVQYIVLSRQKLGSVDFLLVLFFLDKISYQNFKEENQLQKIHNLIRETYILFVREDNMLFESKQKILRRMAFSYVYYQIRKTILNYKNVYCFTIQFDTEITDFSLMNENIQTIKEAFQNIPQCILIRNHFYKVSLYCKNEGSLIQQIRSIWRELSFRIQIETKTSESIYNLENWTFLNT